MENKALAELRAEWGELYEVHFSRIEETCYFRAMTLEEQLFAATLEEYEFEDFICDSVIVYPENINLNKIKPGEVGALAVQVIQISGFSNPKLARQILHDARERTSAVHVHMKAVILSVFDELGYSDEDLNKLTFYQLCDVYALAEKILLLKKMIHDPSLQLSELEILDPEEIKKKDKELQDKELEKLLKAGPDAEIEGTKFATAKVGDPVAEKLAEAMARLSK